MNLRFFPQKLQFEILGKRESETWQAFNFLIFWFLLDREIPLIALVIARTALYSIDSNLWWKELLKPWSKNTSKWGLMNASKMVIKAGLGKIFVRSL